MSRGWSRARSFSVHASAKILFRRHSPEWKCLLPSQLRYASCRLRNFVPDKSIVIQSITFKAKAVSVGSTVANLSTWVSLPSRTQRYWQDTVSPPLRMSSIAGQLSLATRLRMPGDQGEIPVLGLGVFVSSRCEQSIVLALEAGYRNIDTAQIYYNEGETGSAVRKFLAQNSKISRSDIFVTSKLWETDLSRDDMPTSFDALCNAGPWKIACTEAGHSTYSTEGVRAGLQRSLESSGLGYFDLFLLHTPRPGPKARLEAWKALQEAQREGKVRAIGVSNWAPRHIEALEADPDVKTLPAVNQIEFHPWNQQREILTYCQEKGIVVTAYSPLAQGTRLNNSTIGQIASKLGKSPAQVVLRWCVQMGVTIIPKSDRDERIQSNTEIFGWELDSEDMGAIALLDEGQRGNTGEWDPLAWE